MVCGVLSVVNFRRNILKSVCNCVSVISQISHERSSDLGDFSVFEDVERGSDAPVSYGQAVHWQLDQKINIIHCSVGSR